jgi:hypothetical protein
MKLRKILSYSLMFILLLSSNGCADKFLDFFPEDKMTSANFPKNESDIKLLLNGLYGVLRLPSSGSIWDAGFFDFGVLDGATPNSFNWGGTAIDKIGMGSLSPTDGGTLTYIWTKGYSIISRANYLLESIEKVEISDEAKSIYLGEAHFLRGLAYSRLVETYGGVPIITSIINTDEARNLARATKEDTWNQVIADYDIAIEKLSVTAPQVGRATKGAALGMKMRAYLYQGKYQNVLDIVKQIDALNKYSLFPSYEGLFKLANENNKEVLFDIQYIDGENGQGSSQDQYAGIGTGSYTRGSRYVPTHNLVDAYERIDGSNSKYSTSVIDLNNPYDGWDPRLKFTIVVPGSYFLGYRFPNYIYPGGAYTHPGCRVKDLGTRKYFIEPFTDLPTPFHSSLNFSILRYADVILSKAEAIIETNGSVDEAVALINRIRTERTDVKITTLPLGLSREAARDKLRHERRIEFAFEGTYWSDIKRWNIGKSLYPIEIRDHNNSLIETKFPNGYLEYYNLLPIPNNEISLNKNLVQNPGW